MFLTAISYLLFQHVRASGSVDAGGFAQNDNEWVAHGRFFIKDTHKPASCLVHPFGVLVLPRASAVYTYMKNNDHSTTLHGASQSDIQSHVKNLLIDVVGMAGLVSVKFLNELSIFRALG